MKKYLIVIFAGLALLANGWDALRLSWGAGSTPEQVELSALESGAQVQSSYLEIGPHYRLTSEITYAIRKKRSAETTDQTRVSYAFMPLVSEQMVVQAIKSGKIKPDGPIQLGTSPAVVIKTQEFERYGQLQQYANSSDVLDSHPKVSGMLINALGGLTEEQAELIASSMPELDLNKVLILEVDQSPASWPVVVGLLGGGALLLAFGIGWPIRQFIARRKQPPTPQIQN